MQANLKACLDNQLIHYGPFILGTTLKRSYPLEWICRYHGNLFIGLLSNLCFNLKEILFSYFFKLHQTINFIVD